MNMARSLSVSFPCLSVTVMMCFMSNCVIVTSSLSSIVNHIARHWIIAIRNASVVS